MNKILLAMLVIVALPFVYVLFVLLLAIVMVHGFHVTSVPSSVKFLDLPLQWAGDNSEWARHALMWLFGLFGIK